MERSEHNRVLVIYLEPAPYIIDYAAKLRAAWLDEMDVFYMHGAMTQPWDLDVARSGDHLLPPNVFAAVMKIRSLLDSGRYTLLSLPGWGHPVLCVALCLARWFQIPVVMETDTLLAARQPILSQMIKAALYPFLFRIPSFFLPAGTPQAAFLRHYGVETSRIRILRMTVDVVKISALVHALSAAQKRTLLHRYNVPEHVTTFLYVGRLEPYKGITDLLLAFERLAAELDDVCLVIVGSGSEAALVEQHAAGNEFIRYLGRLPADRVWEAYAVADAFILPSHFEPWGLVVNEAMASGLAVIVTDQVGCSEDLVKDGESGFVVPAGSPEKLLAAMSILASQPLVRQQMGVAARRHIAAWTLEQSAEIASSTWREAIKT